MKKNAMMMLALVAMTAGVALNAEETQNATSAPTVANAATSKAAENAATKLSVEEQSFVAKLNDQNRKSFNDKLTSDQRKAVMVAVKNGADADDAVQKMVVAKDLKEASAVANVETDNVTPAK